MNTTGVNIRFNGVDALLLFKETGLDNPFILISGSVGEEKAAEIMKVSVHDFVGKGDLIIESLGRDVPDGASQPRHKRMKATKHPDKST